MFDTRNLNRLFSEFNTITGVISILLNLCLLYLVIYKSPVHFGAYKRLMFTISLFEIFYSIVDMLLVPIHFSHNSVGIALTDTEGKWFGRSGLLVLSTIYWAFFGASLAIFALHFIYRYLVISGHELLSTFNSWKFALWLSFPLFFALTLASIGVFFSRPNPETNEVVREKVFEVLGRNIDDFEYLGFHLYDTDDHNQIVKYRFNSIFSISVFMIITMFSFCVIIFFGIRCYKRIMALFKKTTSSYHKNLQSQLFLALVIQTLIPIALMHIPAATVITAIILNNGFGVYSTVLSTTVTLYPAIDPLPNFFIIKPYRNTIFSEFPKCLMDDLKIHLSQKSVIIVLTDTEGKIFGRSGLLVLNTIYWAFFGASLAIFALHFIYRYLVISGHKLLSTFNSWKFALWLSFPLLFALAMASIGVFLSRPDPETNEVVREKVFEVLGRNIDDFEYLGFHLYDTDDHDRIVKYRFNSIFSISVFMMITVISFCVIIFFGVGCYKRIIALFETTTSSHHKNLQFQLFFALVIQTLIPIALMHIPAATVITATVLNIGIGVYSTILSTTITLYPAIDPLPNFFIIKPYRNAIFKFLKRKEDVEILNLARIPVT